MSPEKKEEAKVAKPKEEILFLGEELRELPVVQGATPPEIPQPKPREKKADSEQ